MTIIEEREAVCSECSERRTAGTYRWCAGLDETHAERGDCARSRTARFNARVTLPEAGCAAWQPGYKIYLPEIPTVVYTADKEHCRARWPRVERIMGRLGFTDWRFFVGAPGDPYWQAIRPEYVGLLRGNEPPLLILEDDIGVREWRPWIAPPPQSEMIYLGGGGAWRGSRLVDEARRRLPGHRIKKVREIGWEEMEGYPDWVRAFGMFGTHAILYTSRRVMLEVADAIEAGVREVDVMIGMNQWRWQAMLLRVPMFFQDDGHNNAGTWDYSPLPPVTREQRRADALAARGA